MGINAKRPEQVKPSEPDRKTHWESTWSEKKATETSWYQEVPRQSLSMIAHASLGPDDPLIDIGGGASVLVDHLLIAGYRNLAVLDISAGALEQAQQRLGDDSRQVEWIEADVTQYDPDRKFALWHDRATFHFLTTAEDRASYVAVLKKALITGGQAVITAFAPGAPRKCSGLEIIQYDAETLGLELGPEFLLNEEDSEIHITPLGREQKFGVFRFTKNS
jgi:SAM-dependent methyltransferase